MSKCVIFYITDRKGNTLCAMKSLFIGAGMVWTIDWPCIFRKNNSKA